MAEDGFPLRVKIPSLGLYWLLDLPDVSSPIVKQYTKDLSQSCDLALADSSCLEAVIARTVGVIQTCNKVDAIRLGSQCNRLNKYSEATATYIFLFKDIAEYAATKLHYTMKCLYDYRPPREIEAKILLESLAGISQVVLHAAERQSFLLKKLSSVTQEGFTAFLKKKHRPSLRNSCTLAHFSDGTLVKPNDAEKLAIFNDAACKLFIFWSKLADCLKIVSSMTNDIQPVEGKALEKQDEGFDDFKMKVIKISANWIALKRFCLKYINRIKPLEFRKDVEDTLPQSLDDVIFDLSAHFNDIEVHLLSYSEHDLQIDDSIQIYGSWVQPKIDATVYHCSELAQDAKELISSFDAAKASKKLVEIEQQSQHVAIMVVIYLKRLRVIESYAECQQENLKRNRVKLESEKKEKEDKREELVKELTEAKERKDDLDVNKAELEKKKKEAKEENKHYESKLKKLDKKSLKYLCTKQILNICKEKVQNCKGTIHLNEKNFKDWSENIENTKFRIQRLDKEITELSKKIDKVKQEKEYSFERLKEMKEAIAALKKSIYSWETLLVHVEHAKDRNKCFLNLIEKARKNKDSKRALGSTGMQTKLSNFTDAFKTVEHLFSKQWEHVISYDYTCDVCGAQQSGLPLPVDSNTVVCCSCALTYIE